MRVEELDEKPSIMMRKQETDRERGDPGTVATGARVRRAATATTAAWKFRDDRGGGGRSFGAPRSGGESAVWRRSARLKIARRG